MARFKRVFLVLMLSVAVLVSVVWFVLPLERHATEVAELEARFLAAKANQVVTRSPFEESSVSEMSRYSPAHHEPVKYLPQLVGDKDPELARAVSNFERDYAIARQEMAAPERMPSYTQNSLLEALQGYCRVTRLQGRHQQAAQACVDSLRICGQARTTWHRVRLQNAALTNLEHYLISNPPAAQLAHLEEALRSSELPEDLEVRSMEFAIGLYSAEREWEKGPNSEIPGLTRRLKRMFDNQAVETLARIRSHELLPLSKGLETGAALLAFLDGSLPSPQLTYVPNLQRAARATVLRQGLDLVWVQALQGKRVSQPLRGIEPARLTEQRSTDSLKVTYPLPVELEKALWDSSEAWKESDGRLVLDIQR